MKKLIFVCALFVFVGPTQAQLLRKLKDKVNKTIDKATGGEDTSSSSSSSNSERTDLQDDDNSAKDGKSKQLWCDSIIVEGADGSGPVKIDESKSGGVLYEMVYSSAGKLEIMYNESALGIGKSKNGYRLILNERVNNKSQYVVVQDGKVVATGSTVKEEYLGNGVSNDLSLGNSGAARDEEMKKYVIADSTKHKVAGHDAKDVKINKVTDSQMDMAMAMARQTDEYKSMSAEEKKEFEETMKKAMAQNNAMAGQTISMPGQQAGSYATISGYRFVVKGKTLAKFSMPPVVEVNDAGTFAVGVDESGNPSLVINGKKTALDQSKVQAMTGWIVRSPDQKKFVYIEQKPLSDAEMDKVMDDPANAKYAYTVIKSDGSMMQVVDYGSTRKFMLTNAGNIITFNNQTGDVYADGKKAGSFNFKEGTYVDVESLMVGSSISKIAYYDGSNGSINYLDGTVLRAGIMYPTVVTENGRNYLSWFRKCRNNIYKARYAF